MVCVSCRRLSPRTFAYSAIGITIILCVYYANYTTDINQSVSEPHAEKSVLQGVIATVNKEKSKNNGTYEKCPNLQPAEADINTLDVFKDFDFQVSLFVKSMSGRLVSFCFFILL